MQWVFTIRQKHDIIFSGLFIFFRRNTSMEHFFAFSPALIVLVAMIALRIHPRAVYRFVKEY